MIQKTWYNLFRFFVKIGLFFYSKRILVSGEKNIPKKGAVLFAINHPNGLIDPLIATTNIKRDNYYLEEGNYDLVPVQYQNISSGDFEKTSDAPYQSAQRRGQFIYSRYMDIANQNPHYMTSAIGNEGDGNIVNYEHNLSNTGSGAGGGVWPSSTGVCRT